MEDDPFLASQTGPQLKPILEDDLSNVVSFTSSPEIQECHPLVGPSISHFKKLASLHRCKMALAMVVMRDPKLRSPQVPKP
ncbi:hypothetical protein SLA2020_354830 [Shorea laevis]